MQLCVVLRWRLWSCCKRQLRNHCGHVLDLLVPILILGLGQTKGEEYQVHTKMVPIALRICTGYASMQQLKSSADCHHVILYITLNVCLCIMIMGWISISSVGSTVGWRRWKSKSWYFIFKNGLFIVINWRVFTGKEKQSVLGCCRRVLGRKESRKCTSTLKYRVNGVMGYRHMTPPMLSVPLTTKCQTRAASFIWPYVALKLSSSYQQPFALSAEIQKTWHTSTHTRVMTAIGREVQFHNTSSSLYYCCWASSTQSKQPNIT